MNDIIVQSSNPVDKLIETAYSGHRIQQDEFGYSLNFSALVAAAFATSQITIAADSDFILSEVACAANVAAAAQTYNTETLPLCTLMLIDTSTGRNLFDNDLPISLVCGSGQGSRPLTVPRMLPAKTVLQVRVTNYDAAVTYNLRFAFLGRKIFDYGPA